MGRQIEYYMELDSFKQVIKYSIELGFAVIQEEQNNILIKNVDEVDFQQHLYLYLYLELEDYPLITSRGGYIDTLCSPIIEASYSRISEQKQEISKARLWVSTGFWNNNKEFIGKSSELDKKYSLLVKLVKKITINTEFEVKAQNPQYSGTKFIQKAYITPYLLEMIRTTEYDCI